jgi:hypothetical protein
MASPRRFLTPATLYSFFDFRFYPSLSIAEAFSG